VLTPDQFNGTIVHQVGQLTDSAHRAIDKLQPFGHQLNPAEIDSIVRVLTDTADRVRAVAQQASQSPQLSMQAVAHIQAAMQDLYNAANMYAGMSQGQAAFENQNRINQLRANLATAQALYSNCANDAERRVSAVDPLAATNPSVAAGYGPILPSTSATSAGTPAPSANLNPLHPPMPNAAPPQPALIYFPPPQAAPATPAHAHRTTLPVPGN
jgi:hypothetical protein